MTIRRISRTPALVLGCAAAVLLAACGKTDEPPAPKTVTAPPPPVAAIEPPPPTPAAPALAQVDDAALASRVKAALLADPEVAGLNINVEANQGVVQLSGFVDSRAQTDKAASLAGAVEGVRSVDNKLDMKTGSRAAGETGETVAKVDDSAITNQIKASLLGDPYLNNLDVAIVTRNGEVQLSGFVPSQEQAEDVIAMAHKVEGVKNVVSTLTFGQPAPGGGS